MRTILIASLVALAGCSSAPTNASMDNLTRELQETFPSQIASVVYENAPPLDPPTLFIDIAPGISPQDELDFLCNSVKPRVDAVNVAIEATTTYGYYLGTDCSSAP